MLFKFIFKRNNKKPQKKSEQKFMDNWMNLTKEERLEVDFKEKNESMKKKKAFLKSIREEYIKIKKEK